MKSQFKIIIITMSSVLSFERRSIEAMKAHRRRLIDLRDEANALETSINATQDILDEVKCKLIKDPEAKKITVHRYITGAGAIDIDDLLINCSVEEVTETAKYDKDDGKFESDLADGWEVPDGYVEEHASSSNGNKYKVKLHAITIDLTKLKLDK